MKKLWPESVAERVYFATTICWRCATVYRMHEANCPHCQAANANVDYEKAHQEMSAAAVCPQCNAEKEHAN